MEIALVANPTAGKGTARAAMVACIERLRQRGVGVRELVGRDGAEALALCHQAVASGVDALVALGGDGMVHLALQSVAGTTTPLGIVAAGTGNDLATHLGLPIRSPVAAADVVAGGFTRPMDAVRVTPGESWFGAVLGAGFDAIVSERANRLRWPKGPQRYNLAIARELPRFQPLEYRLTLDGDVWETRAMLVSVANARSCGGGMKLTPDAQLDDGLVDVFVLLPLGKVRFARLFPTVYDGAHVGLPEVVIRRARVVTVEAAGMVAYADGERVAPLPLTCECVPGAVQVLVRGGHG